MRKLTDREFAWGIWIISIVAITIMSIVFGPDNGRDLGWRWDF